MSPLPTISGVNWVAAFMAYIYVTSIVNLVWETPYLPALYDLDDQKPPN